MEKEIDTPTLCLPSFSPTFATSNLSPEPSTKIDYPRKLNNEGKVFGSKVDAIVDCGIRSKIRLDNVNVQRVVYGSGAADSVKSKDDMELKNIEKLLPSNTAALPNSVDDMLLYTPNHKFHTPKSDCVITPASNKRHLKTESDSNKCVLNTYTSDASTTPVSISTPR